MNCPQCKQPLAPSARFCTRCGSSISYSQSSRPDPLPATVLTSDSTDPLIGRVLDSKYLLISRLGEGGMGAVYRARRTLIGDDVAVKLLHQKFVKEPAALERFRREARAAALLKHPNVVAIYDYGEAIADQAPAYIVMELVTGLTLRELLEREGRLEPHRAVGLMRSICAGVAAAHRNQVVHRDLKPDNIIVIAAESEEERESAKVLDFGIAKLRDMTGGQTLTQEGAVIGTPYYMSPEQCRAERLDSRSDVYSLGAMLYEMLAGRPPFEAESWTGVVAKHLTQAPPRLSAGVGVGQSLEEVIMRALRKETGRRQADAMELARELQAAMSKPVTKAIVGRETAEEEKVMGETREARAWDQGYQGQASPARIESAPNVAAKKSRTGLVLAIAGLIVVVAIGTGVGLWLLSKTDNQQANRNSVQQPITSTNANISQVENRNTARSNENKSAQIVTVPPPIVNANNSGLPVGPSGGIENANVSPGPSVARAESKILGDVRLSQSDIAGLSSSDLRILRNTVYARHGRTFDKPELQRHFNSRPWYRPRYDYSDSELTSTDRANVELILAAEKSGGKY